MMPLVIPFLVFEITSLAPAQIAARRRTDGRRQTRCGSVELSVSVGISRSSGIIAGLIGIGTLGHWTLDIGYWTGRLV
jgi:hypothetical protein